MRESIGYCMWQYRPPFASLLDQTSALQFGYVSEECGDSDFSQSSKDGQL